MQTIDLIKQELEKGKVVYRDIEGLHSAILEEFVNQPADGILYDLNRNEAVILQFIDDPKWVNDFACAQVIRYLKKELDDFKKSCTI